MRSAASTAICFATVIVRARAATIIRMESNGFAESVSKLTTCIINIRSGKHYDIFGGRPGPLGNPYVIGAYALIDGRDRLVRTRDEAIDLYAKLFDARITLETEFRKIVLDCHDKTLGCFCRPARCHLDVIVTWIRKNYHRYCEFCLDTKRACVCPPF